MDLLISAALALAEPLRLTMLAAGVLLGLVIGVIPGIGGIFGLTLLIPVSYALDPISAFTLLLGMASVTTTSDTIPAVLIGVPGTVGAAATVLDGHELAKNRQAARALGAAYSASMIGGVFGALLLALSLPVMRPELPGPGREAPAGRLRAKSPGWCGRIARTRPSAAEVTIVATFPQ